MKRYSIIRGAHSAREKRKFLMWLKERYPELYDYAIDIAGKIAMMYSKNIRTSKVSRAVFYLVWSKLRDRIDDNEAEEMLKAMGVDYHKTEDIKMQIDAIAYCKIINDIKEELKDEV